MVGTSIKKELNVSQSLSRSSNFDAIRYKNIKISQVHWCLRLYLGFTITFPLLYLFECKFVYLIIFFFFFTRQNLHARKIGRVSEDLRAQARLTGIGRAICPGLASTVEQGKAIKEGARKVDKCNEKTRRIWQKFL